MTLSLLAGIGHAQNHHFDTFDFSKSDSIAALYPKYSLHDLNDLSHKLTQPLSTEVEKIRAIYTWVSTNIENDYETYIRNNAKRRKLKSQPEKLFEWNQKANKIVFQKLLSEHKSIYSGYAYLIQELAYLAGISCEIINGYGKTADFKTRETTVPNHSWNVIKIGHYWYFIDATWSSGLFDLSDQKFITQFDDTYFLTTPDLFILNHFPIDSSKAYACQKNDLEAFLQSPFVNTGAIKFKTFPINPSQFENTIHKGEIFSIHLQMENNSKADQIQLKVNRKIVKSNIEFHSDKTIKITHKFRRKGRFLLDIIINGEPAISYLVIVIN